MKTTKQFKLGAKKIAIKIVGLKYGKKIPTGTTLRLIPDTNNKYDPDAVMAVTMTGEKVGFVANNKKTKGTLSNPYYRKFKSATEIKNIVDLDKTYVCGNINIKGSYGLMNVTI